MKLLFLFLLLVFSNLRVVDSSRGQSDRYEDASNDRVVPVSPVQAYRKRLQAAALSATTSHAVRPFVIQTTNTSSQSNQLSLSPNISGLQVGSQNFSRLTEDANSKDSKFGSDVSSSLPVYRDERITSPVGGYARSSDRSLAYTSSPDLLSLLSTAQLSKSRDDNPVANGPPYVVESAVDNRDVVTDVNTNGMESKIVEFRGCLMRDFDRVWSRPARSGQKFVPRNELESTCKVYIEKMEHVRDQCMEAMGTLLAAKAKPVAEKKERNKSWWRFLTFGR